MAKIVGQTGKMTTIREGKILIHTCLKIDIVSHPTCVGKYMLILLWFDSVFINKKNVYID